ncbi:MAG: class I SAM-dependent methyltransferase [Gemmatimonadota bacterium]
MQTDEYRRMFELEERHWWFRAKRRMVYDLLRTWMPASGRRVVDVGCGTGVTLRDLPPGTLGIGLDPSVEALQLSRSRGLLRLLRGAAEELPIGSATADAVLALDIIEHVDDDVQALREVARVLKPGGIAILTVPAFPALWSAHDEALHHKRRYTRKLLEARVAEAGLTTRLGGYGYASIFPPAALLRLLRRAGSGIRRPAGGGASQPRSDVSAGSDVRDLPGWLNTLAYALLAWEVPFIRKGRLPVGLSLVCVVSPAGGEARPPVADGP